MIDLIAPPRRGVSPNDIALAMTGRPYMSYSEISTFQACPLKWQFQYVDKAKQEQLSSAMILGSAVHAAIQVHMESLMAHDRPLTVDGLMDSYREHWKKESGTAPIQYAKGQDSSTMEATARRMLETFMASEHAKPAGQIIGIEESFRIKLADNLPDLAGRVDMITHANDELVVTDFKTARSMWADETAEDRGEQLILYAQGCEPIARELDAKVKLQFVIITKTKEPKVEAIPISIDPNRMDRSKRIITQVFTAMQTGITYPVPSPMNCATCPFKKRCEAWKG